MSMPVASSGAASAQAESARYVICDEHTLAANLGKLDLLQVLHTSVLRGAVFEVHTGCTLRSRFRCVRPATAQDFESMRVSLPADFAEQ